MNRIRGVFAVADAALLLVSVYFLLAEFLVSSVEGGRYLHMLLCNISLLFLLSTRRNGRVSVSRDTHYLCCLSLYVE